LPVDPKGGENPFFPRLDLAQNQKKRIITVIACQPSPQSDRPRNREAVQPLTRIAREHMVDSVLEILSTFLADADCASL
jgi:hypothetical protein